MADYPLTAEAIKTQFKRAGIHFVVALPDRVTSHYLLKGILADPDFLDSINAIRGVAVEGHFPVCIVVGLLGKEPDVAPTKSKKYGVKIIEPILDIMGIEHHLIERDSDAGQIAGVIEKSFSTSSPSAILIGREPR